LSVATWTKSSYSEIWQHLVYGLVTSNAIVALADPTIFPNKESLTTQLATQEKQPVQSVQSIYSDVNSSKEEGLQISCNLTVSH